MSYTPDDQLFGGPLGKLIEAIEETQAVIKARRLDSAEWNEDHLNRITIFNQELEIIIWKARQFKKDNR